jgi:hypothetical protein
MDSANMHITKKRDLWFCLAWIAAGNFILFIIIAVFVGCAAGAKNGHYYLMTMGWRGSNDARVSEVPALLYRFCQVHMWVTFPLMLVAPLAFRRAKQLEREIGDYDPVTSRSG